MYTWGSSFTSEYHSRTPEENRCIHTIHFDVVVIGALDGTVTANAVKRVHQHGVPCFLNRFSKPKFVFAYQIMETRVV